MKLPIKKRNFAWGNNNKKCMSAIILEYGLKFNTPSTYH